MTTMEFPLPREKQKSVGPRLIANDPDRKSRAGGLPGDKLPPQRSLADKLKVAVGSVTRAYGQRFEWR
jgi:hypothetical protein